jgi:cation diffusion facilitator CzcD-associated flavoprotein CzcO
LPLQTTIGSRPAAASRAADVDFDVGVVGAGFGGLLAALRLKAAGRSFVVFERGAAVGGVWRDNRYPGCACDVRSQLYSFAERPNPQWSSNYAGRAEIFDYLQGVARDDGLLPHMRLGAEVCAARFLEEQGCWRVETGDGGVTRVRVLILATGPLNRPHFPQIPGRDSFAGVSVHSSAWDPALDLRGKRVAVIGSAASAVQIVPNIAPIVAGLSLFQRSANWVIPRSERRRSRLERWLFRRAPVTQWAARGLVYWAMEGAGLAVLGFEPAAQVLVALAHHNLRGVKDPALRRRLTPQDRIGCKRILVSDDYYPALNRPNVELVTAPIASVTADGIRTQDGVERSFDVIVWATGFHVADPDDPMHVVGRAGRVLGEEWRDRGMQGFLGIHVAGYPNLAFLLGPNSGPAASSAVHVIESQMDYIAQFIAAAMAQPAGVALDVDADQQAAWNDQIQERLARTAWNSGCRNWYVDRRGRNTTMYPGVTSQYRRATRRLRTSAYVAVRARETADLCDGEQAD